MNRLILLPLLSAAALPLNAQISVDFEEASDLDDFSVENGGTQQAAGVGIDGSGGLNHSDSSMSAGYGLRYTATTFSADSVGFSVDYSIYLYYDADGQSSSNNSSDRIAGFGLTDSAANADFGNGAHQHLVSVLVGAPSTGTLEIRTHANGDTGTTSASDSFAVTDDTWYRVDANFAIASATEWDVTSTVTDYGSDGLTAGATVASSNGSITFSDAALGTLWAAMTQAENDRTGILAYDNMTVAVPEPSTYAFLFGLVCLGWIGYRRRSR